jgi:LDH2 family malate/lactate/ureidoglycolate dehydrogenase
MKTTSALAGHLVSQHQLQAFAFDVLARHGVSDEQAMVVAEGMAWSDLIGRSTHGIARLKIHVDRIAKGVLNPDCKPVFAQTGNSVGLLDGDRGFGHFVTNRAMRHAIEMAQEHGVGVVGVRNSNFFGAAACYVHQAAEAGMISLAMSNSVPNVAAYGGREPVFGTNPLGFGAPMANGRHLMLDMATSAWSASAVRATLDRGETLPPGVAVDEQGNEITNPRPVKKSTLLPLGGAKGYGLAMMIEMLSAVITGAGVSAGVASLFTDMTRNGDNGHFVLALDVTRFMPIETYHARMEDLINTLLASQPNGEVLYPGEKRWQVRDANLQNGIALSAGLAATLDQLAAPLGLAPPWCR